MSETDLRHRLIEAARRADWIQVVLNQGPPCFHFEPDSGKFCLRAERWAGHHIDGDPGHAYVPLHNLLADLSIGEGRAEHGA